MISVPIVSFDLLCVGVTGSDVQAVQNWSMEARLRGFLSSIYNTHVQHMIVNYKIVCCIQKLIIIEKESFRRDSGSSSSISSNQL